MYYYCHKKPNKRVPWGVIIPAVYSLAYLFYLLQKQVPVPEFELPEIQKVEAKEVSPAPTIPLEESVEAHIQRLWGERANIAIAIAKAESGMNCKAVNGSNSNGSIDRGLFQINSIHNYNVSDLFDCHKNIDIAYKIYLQKQSWTGDGFQAWSVYNNKRYLKFL